MPPKTAIAKLHFDELPNLRTFLHMDVHIPIFTMNVLEMKKKMAEANELAKDNEELKKQLEERDLRIKELEELQNRNENPR